MMKIGMNLLLWTGHLTKEHIPTVEKIKAAGFDGVEVPIFEGDEKHFSEMKKELDRIGLKCSAVTVVNPDTNPISPDESVRKKALERLKWALNMAGAVGADVLAGPMHSALGVFSGEGPTDDEKKRATEVLRQAAEHAKTVNVRIAIEYLNRFESYFLTTALDAVALVRAVNHPNFAMMYDTFHANIEEKDPAAAYTVASPHVIHYHVSEADRGTPGSGHVPWREHFKALRKSNYDGWLTIEAFGRALPQLAAATRVWRDFFPTREQVYVEGYKFIRRMWDQACGHHH
jgi:D-psicose/D-tagatose/L-ribulose 3-epimerase